MPYWLDEAYSIPGLHIDVGAPTRSLKNWLAAVTLLEKLDFGGAGKHLDFGSGDGLFARLMRSSGFNFYAQDKLKSPTYMNYFSVRSIKKETPQVLTAFEVFEHLPNPRETLNNLFGLQAPLILFTTWLNDSQPEEWIYYLPECGQHVFFYSDKGLRTMAEAHGYRMQVSQYFYVLTHKTLLSSVQLAITDDFCLNSVEQVSQRIPDLLASVVMGNENIESDFVLANKIFSAALNRSARARALKYDVKKS